MNECEHKFNQIKDYNDNDDDDNYVCFYCEKCLVLKLKRYSFVMDGWG